MSRKLSITMSRTLSNMPKTLSSMLSRTVCVIFFLVFVSSSADSGSHENDFEARLRSAVEEAQKNEALWQDHMRFFEGSDDQRVKAAGGFNCTFIPPSDPVPTSVHELKPGDIKVVAAMGDSLTAGFAMEAKTAFGVLTEWRGRVWSIGGDDSVDKYATLPNFLRFYNPSLVGFSTGKGMIPSVAKPGSNLDVAVSGAKAQDMPAQATKLIERIKNFPEPIDFEKDWKLVTIFIGANDLCAYNKEKLYYSAQHYYEFLKQTLEVLRKMPRTFVNLVEVLEATMVSELDMTPICKAFHSYECPDFMDKKGNHENIEAGKQARIQYQKMVETLTGEYADANDDDFTVVHQPFFKNTVPPLHKKGIWKGRPDMSYFAPDCFHFSGKADAAAAEALWNNMFEAEHEKRQEWRVGERLVCPTASNPYLKTVKNSNPSWRPAGAKRPIQAEPSSIAVDNAFKSYPSSHAATWSFIGLLIAITLVAILMYFVKTRQMRSRDVERHSLLATDDEDSIFDSNYQANSKDEIALTTLQQNSIS